MLKSQPGLLLTPVKGQQVVSGEFGIKLGTNPAQLSLYSSFSLVSTANHLQNSSTKTEANG